MDFYHFFYPSCGCLTLIRSTIISSMFSLKIFSNRQTARSLTICLFLCLCVCVCGGECVFIWKIKGLGEKTTLSSSSHHSSTKGLQCLSALLSIKSEKFTGAFKDLGYLTLLSFLPYNLSLFSLSQSIATTVVAWICF